MADEAQDKKTVSTPSKMERLEIEVEDLKNLLHIDHDKIIALVEGIKTLDREISRLKNGDAMNKRRITDLQNRQKDLVAGKSALEQVILKGLRGSR